MSPHMQPKQASTMQASTMQASTMQASIMLVLTLEFVGKIIHHDVVEILSPQVCVARRRLNLENAVVNGQ